MIIVNALGILDNPNAAHSSDAAGKLNPTSDVWDAILREHATTW